MAERPGNSDRQNPPDSVVGPSSHGSNGDGVLTINADPWQKHHLLSLDGGGIRGYWSLLALELLMEYVGRREEALDDGAYDSFQPEQWPNHVSSAPLTEKEKIKVRDNPNSVREDHGLPRPRRYLPCHYFDLICGSSTGGLIAIMLGRFRMTVADCIYEYRSLGQEVFGKPRKFFTLRFGVGERTKYKASRLEKTFKDVTQRRNEEADLGDSRRSTFPYGKGLCSTFVTTLASFDHDVVQKTYLIRSYDHVNKISQTPQASRANTGSSVVPEMRPREATMTGSSGINYEKAQEFKIWDVARAATAAEFYFEPMKIENPRTEQIIIFTDGGFSQANNPTSEGTREIKDLYPGDAIGVVVSVGTARSDPVKGKKSFWKTVPKATRRYANSATDPEITHKNMQETHKNKHEYYRLNHKGGLQTELDEWEPKQSFTRSFRNKNEGGSRTMATIEAKFNSWASDPECHNLLWDCAKSLVNQRRHRCKTSKWERFAIASRFECRYQGCDTVVLHHRKSFEDHMRNSHDLDGEDLEREVRKCWIQWRYQPASADRH